MHGPRLAVLALLIAGVSLLSNGAAAQLPQFTELVKDASPAVVNISATREAKPQAHDRFNGQDVPEFFRRFFENMPRERGPRPSAGSGFLISDDGYILTNHHVVKDADEIVVALNDRRERLAEVVGADPLSDLALLKIDAQDLPTVKMGNSDHLEVGEWVIAIGSPFGFEYSVTAGIVSAKGRSLPDSSSNYVPFIQTDVAINPGNSGGPLFNLDGEVVGINSQIFTRSGGFMGLSFAIPIDVAMNVVEQLKEKGSVSRGWLGVLIQKVDRDLAESFGLKKPAGALVTRVYPDSPAAAAGLKEGDIILEFDDRHIDLSSELPHIVGRTKAGSEVEVVVVRDGERMSLDVTVGKLDESEVMGADQSDGPPGTEAGNRLGVEVQGLSANDKEKLGVERGVVVTRVAPGPARSAGIQRGDVITSLNNEWINSVSEFRDMVAELEPNVAIPVRVVRRQTPQYLVIKITD